MSDMKPITYLTIGIVAGIDSTEVGFAGTTWHHLDI